MKLGVGMGVRMRPRRMGCIVTAVVLLGAAAASAQEQTPPNEPTPPYNPPAYTPPPPPPPAYRPPPYAAGRYGAYPKERVPPPPPHVRVPVEVTPSAGFAMSTGVPVVGGTLMLAPSPVFGATVDIGNWFGAHFEIAYMLQSTGLVLQPQVGANQGQYDVTAHHIQIGGEIDILHGGVRPFVGIILGTEWLAPHSDVPDELWFEATFEAGAKVRLTRMLGIRAQAQVTTVAMDARSQVFCANGCYTEWYGIGTSQLALTAGPTLVF